MNLIHKKLKLLTGTHPMYMSTAVSDKKSFVATPLKRTSMVSAICIVPKTLTI